MDCDSFDSEAIESLNLLRPPVKRVPWNRNGDISMYCSRPKNNLKVSSRKLCKNSNLSNLNKRTSQEVSSTSLILKKTSESQILKLYPVLSYASLHYQTSLQNTEQTDPQQADQYAEDQAKLQTGKNKPLIQVTVIPKSDQKTRARLLRKQRIDSKTLQTTSSNHENSIQTKNVYLVVAGRKKEKIYEIKTTGSEKFEKESIKDDAVGNLSNFKNFIMNFNVDRKKKKDKKDAKLDKRNESEAKTSFCKTSDIGKVCYCTPSAEEDDNVDDVRPRKSKVRIFGRLGLTADDRYVLKCQATVDNKPVPIATSTADKQLSSSSLANYCNNQITCQRVGGMSCCMQGHDTQYGDIKSLRDSNIQTDDTVKELLIKINHKNKTCNETQSTQVNFTKMTRYGNGSGAVCKSSMCQTSDHTRCECIPSNNNYPVINNGFDSNNVKPCKSPLVIISVFPKKDNNVPDFVQKPPIESNRSTISENLMIPENILSEENKMTDTKVRIKKTLIPSPSPKGQNTKSKGNKIIEARAVKTSSKNISPLRSKLFQKDSKNGTDSAKQSLQFSNTADKKRKLSPQRSPRGKSPPATPNKTDPQNKKASRQNMKPKPKSPKRNVDVGVNTEHLKTKQDLVDSYTYQLTKQMNSSREKPVESVSKVTVNIDNENEFYDVLFRQSKFTTDLNVRKTMKEASAQKSPDDNHELDSIENFCPNNLCKNRRNSICKPISENQSDDFNHNASRLTLRDSLEIGHRREDKVIKHTQTLCTGGSEELTLNSDNMEYLAPLKHFTGDNCTISDPVERDREIRELLGVEGRRVKSQIKDSQSQASAIGDLSPHCDYQCDTTFALGPNDRIERLSRRSDNNPEKNQFEYQRPHEIDYSTYYTRKKTSNTHFKLASHNKEYEESVATETYCAKLTYLENMDENISPCNHMHNVGNNTGCERTNIGTQYDQRDRVKRSIAKYIESNLNEQFQQTVQKSGTERIYYHRKTRVGRKFNDPKSNESDDVLSHRDSNEITRMSSSKYTKDDKNELYEQTDQKKAKRNIDPEQRHQKSEAKVDKGACIKYNDTNIDESNIRIQHIDSVIIKCLSSDKNSDPNNNFVQTNQTYEKQNKSAVKIYQQNSDKCPCPCMADTKSIVTKGIQPNYLKQNENDVILPNQKCNNNYSNKRSADVDLCDRIGENRNVNNPNIAYYDNLSSKDIDKIKHLSSQQNTNDNPSKDFEHDHQKVVTCKLDDEQQSTKVDKGAKKISNDTNSDQSEHKTQSKHSGKTTCLSNHKNSDIDPKEHFEHTNQKEEPKMDAEQKRCSSERIDKNANKKYKGPDNKNSISKMQTKHSDKTKRLSNNKNSDEGPNSNVEKSNKKEVKRIKHEKNRESNGENTAKIVCSSYVSNKSLKKCISNDKTECFKNTNADPNKNVEGTKQKDGKNANDQYQTKQYDKANKDQTSLYQQLTLNRNVQIFLQVEQFAKQKPIVLSKKQYKRIKKTIQHAVLDKYNGKGCIYNRSVVSVREHKVHENNDVLVFSNTEAQTRSAFKAKDVKVIKEGIMHTKFKKRYFKEKEPEATVVLYSRGNVMDKKLPATTTRRASSSLEIRNASDTYRLHVSSTDIGSIGSSSYARRNQSSIKTIFRGHKKPHTPNLGTSAFSLLTSANINESQSLKLCSPDSKARKPFLKRLMSCLVMRSETPSKVEPVSNVHNVVRSVDSYHISTSLGAIEMTSSIYDTTASFFSDHTIHPLNNKLKKSFFSSIKGFLTSRKS